MQALGHTRQAERVLEELEAAWRPSEESLKHRPEAAGRKGSVPIQALNAAVASLAFNAELEAALRVKARMVRLRLCSHASWSAFPLVPFFFLSFSSPPLSLFPCSPALLLRSRPTTP